MKQDIKAISKVATARERGLLHPGKIQQSDAEELREIARLLSTGAPELTNEQKRRVADLILALMPQDPGFAIGDAVEVRGRALFINGLQGGTTIIKLSDIARICVFTRFVHKTPVQSLAEAVTHLLDAALINKATVAKIMDLIVAAERHQPAP